MARIYTFLSMLLAACCMQAQNSLVGRVVDKETKQAISDVIIQYGAYADDYIFSDSDGIFHIQSLSSQAPILFQCLGYKPLSVTPHSEKGEWIIELEPNPLSLAPIIVSPQIADKLLKNAAINTKTNLLTDENISYLLHFLQWANSSVSKNEIFMKYVSRLPKNKLKKSSYEDDIPYSLNLVDITHLQSYDLPLANLFGAEYHPSRLFTFGDCKDYKVTMSYLSDTTVLAIDIEPVAHNAWAKGQFLIAKQDKALLSIELESVDSILEKEQYKRYLGQQHKVIRMKGSFQFKRWNGKYYLSSAFSSYRFRMIDSNGNTDEMEYSCDVVATGLAGKQVLKKRGLSGYCQEMFYIPNTTLKDFWTDPTDIIMTDNDRSDDPNFKKDKRTPFSSVGKSILGLGALCGILWLINSM